MSNRVAALVKPALLRWARESSGYSLAQLEKSSGIKQSKILEWEEDKSKPSIPQLRKIAHLYNRPIAVFYLSEPPKGFSVMHDYRKFADLGEVAKSPALLLEIRKAHYRREVAIELANMTREEMPVFNKRITIGEDPEIIALKIRKMLGITIEHQAQWRNKDTAFREWKNAVEKNGVLVFQTDRYSKIELDEMRAFSISNQKLPAIVINSSDQSSGKIFSLIHELSHLLLHNDGICNLEGEDYYRPSTPDQIVEVFCNRVSGATLVPQDALFDHDIVVNSPKGTAEWADGQIHELADYFAVSKEVILRRLLILGRTTLEYYKHKREQYLDEYFEWVRKKKEMDKGKKFQIPYFRMVLRNNGITFTRLVLNAYYQDSITASAVTSYMGAKFEHVRKIENVLLAAPVG